MISVIIPLYNKASYVEKALQSVLNQSYQDWEVIVIDDGSVDDSYIVVKEYTKALCDSVRNKIQLIQQENQGVSATRNRGVDIAKGEWIAFLDADDWWESDFLRELISLTERFPYGGISGCSYRIVDGY